MNRIVTNSHAPEDARIAQLEAEVAWLRRTGSLADVAPLLLRELATAAAASELATRLLRHFPTAPGKERSQ